MGRLLLAAILLLGSSAFADSTLVLEPIVEGPQTAEQLQRNFRAIDDWTDRVEGNADDVADITAPDVLYVPTVPDRWDPGTGTVQSGLDQIGDALVEIPAYEPIMPSNWLDPDPQDDDQAIDDLAEHKSAIDDLGSITETDYDPSGLLECVGPQCLNIWRDASTDPDTLSLCYADEEGTEWNCSGSAAAGASSNAPLDYNGNGEPDFIACGDYDEDGTADMQDVQACYDALTDTSGKHLHLLAFDFARGTLPSPSTADGYLEIVGDTNVEVSCEPGAVLHGHPHDAAGEDYNIAAVFLSGNSHLRFHGCEITGGTPASYDTTGLTNHFRMGMDVQDCDYTDIYDNYIHDTQGSGLVTTGGEFVHIYNNVVERVGGYGDTNVSPPTNAGIEIATDEVGLHGYRQRISNNTIRYASVSIAVRRGATAAFNAQVREVMVDGNNVVRPRVVCFYQGGAVGTHWLNNTCTASEDMCIDFEPATDYYRLDVAGSKDVTFENTKCLGSDYDRSGDPAVWVKAYQTNLTFINTYINGGTFGMFFVPPLRKFVSKGLVTENLRSFGIQQNTAQPAGTTREESIVFDGVEISGTDGDSISHPLYRGIYPFASRPTCDDSIEGEWIDMANAASTTDCTAGAGSVMNRCTCTNGVWTERVQGSHDDGGSGSGATSQAISLAGGDYLELTNVSIDDASNSAVVISGGAWSHMKLTNFDIDMRQWGYLGNLTETTAGDLNCGGNDADGNQTGATDANASVVGKWAFVTNTSDCVMGGGTGAGARCVCTPGATLDTWTVASGQQTTTRHGITIGALTGTGPEIDNISCRNQGTTGACVNLGSTNTAINGSITGVRASYDTVDAAESAATRGDYGIAVAGLGAGWTLAAECLNLENATCIDNVGAAVIAGAPIDSRGAAAADAELCDHAQEVGGTWRNTAGAAATSFEDCKDVGAPAWVAR